MAKSSKGRKSVGRPGTEESVVGLRIIGGTLRRRKLKYSGDERTRPMKDRVREAVFNLLGTTVAGCHAIDLFAGTGALGFEALSRGAMRATFIERHFPTAKLIEENAAAIGVEDRIDVVFGDAFRWTADFRFDEEKPLTVFCSPPYDFYVDRQSEMLELIGRWLDKSPQASHIVVEADERFDMNLLPGTASWDVRTYPPAVVAIASTGY